MKKLSPSAFVKRVHDTIKQYDMLSPGDRVLVAVSGGPDSVCLLEVLVSLRKKIGLEIFVANLDHSIRGAESRKDSGFVKGLARELGLKCESRRENIPRTRDRKKSLEEHARTKRYGFLVKAAQKRNCNVIATGHTMDDQAETVMMKILSGSSLKGISGIPPVRQEKGIKLVRPLIRTEKKDILDHLGSKDRAYRTDHTNRDTKYFRNAVRHEVLPFLERYNPRLKRSLVNLSDSARENLSSVRKSTENAMAGGQARSVGIADIMLQPVAVRREVFRELFERSGGDVKKLTYRHWKDVELLLRAGKKGSSLHLPGGVRVKRLGDTLRFMIQ